MADYKHVVPFILKWEGGYVNHPNDKGGITNKGVTLATYKSFYPNKGIEDLKRITDAEWNHIFKCGYWDKVKGDDIKSQCMADAICNFAYMSGNTQAIKELQRLLGIVDDGKIGIITLNTLNQQATLNEKYLFEGYIKRQMDFYCLICKKNPKLNVFLNGWKNRLNALRKFELN